MLDNLLVEVSYFMKDQDKKLKVTFKKNYINDLLNNTKGASNVAHKVVLLVTEGDVLPIIGGFGIQLADSHYS